MTNKIRSLLILTLILPGALHAKNVGSKGQTNEKGKDSSAQTSVQTDEAERIFETHCIRCHMPPMALSQRTTGTVVMHMRMRARLSKRDEQLLLKYLAP